MAQSRQTPRVWSDAIRGSEILCQLAQAGHERRVLLADDRHRPGRGGRRFLVLRGHHFARSQAVGAPRAKRRRDRWPDRRSAQSGRQRDAHPGAQGAGPALHVAQLRDGQPAIPGERLSRLPPGHRRDGHGRLLPARERPHGDRGPAYPRGDACSPGRGDRARQSLQAALRLHPGRVSRSSATPRPITSWFAGHREAARV